MTVMPVRHYFLTASGTCPNWAKSLPPSAFSFLRPAEGRRGIRFRMAENKRAITLCRVVGIGYRGKGRNP